MGRQLIDLTGRRFGAWTVIERGENYISYDEEHTTPRWICQCDCGTVSLVLGNSLRSGKSTECPRCREEKRVSGLKAYHRAKRELRGGISL